MNDRPFTCPSIPRVLAGVVLLVGAVAAIGHLVRGPVSAFAGALVDRTGFGGVFGAVAFMDLIPGVGFQPALFFGYTGGLGFWPLFAVAWGASFSASLLSFLLGRVFADHPWVMARLGQGRFGQWLRRQGVRAVAFAAVAPFPWGLATVGAGVTGLPLRAFVAGSLLRGLKILVTLEAFRLGWGSAS